MTRYRRAVFLDRDGTINVNRDDYVKSWEEFEFLPRALDALRYLAALDVTVVVVTNQSAIGRGIVPPGQVDEIHARMVQEVEARGGRIDAIYLCPHAPQDACACRKPEPGLLVQAARELDIDLSRSFLIGDRPADIRAGNAAACISILVRSGLGGAPAEEAAAALEAADLFDAVKTLEKWMWTSPAVTTLPRL